MDSAAMPQKAPTQIISAATTTAAMLETASQPAAVMRIATATAITIAQTMATVPPSWPAATTAALEIILTAPAGINASAAIASMATAATALAPAYVKAVTEPTRLAAMGPAPTSLTTPTQITNAAFIPAKVAPV